MILWKCCTQYASKFGELKRGHRTCKGQFSFQSQRKAMPKNAQTTAQLDSSHTLAKSCSKLSSSLQQYVNHEIPDVQAGFRKGRWTRDYIANIRWIIKKAKSSRKPSTSALLTIPKPLTVWITTNCGQFFNSKNTRPPHLPPEKSVSK